MLIRQIFKTALFLTALTAGVAACDEVEEVSEYDNWQERNELVTDSLKSAAADRYVTDPATADAVRPGELFFILNPTASNTEGKQYVYCKKLVANTTGERPNHKGWHSTVSTYYYGTLINGVKFDGNFAGYSLNDTRQLPASLDRAPGPYDSPAPFGVSAVISGWTWALQYMRTGERWMLYIPYQSAYGESGSGSIPHHSTLVFDLVLDAVK